MFPAFLRIAILTHYGLFDIKTSDNGTIQITGGMESNFLKILSEKLKFRYSVVMPEDMEWGRGLPDGNWTGITGLLARNEADIGICAMNIAPERLKVTDFSFPYFQFEYTFATKLPGLLSRDVAMFLPFSKSLWAAILAAILFETIIFKLLLNRKYSFQDVFLFVVGCILNGTKRIRFDSMRETLLHGTWLVSSLVISLCYTSLLLSFLTIPLKEKPITNRHELAEAVRSGSYEAYVLKGASTLDDLLKSKDESNHFIAKHIRENNLFISPPGLGSIKKALKKEKVAVLFSRNSFLLFDDRYLSEDNLYASSLGIGIRKNFCCKQTLDALIHRISAAYLYEKSFNDFMFKIRLKSIINADRETDTIRPLMYQDLVGAFFILFSGYVLASVILILEFLAAGRKRITPS